MNGKEVTPVISYLTEEQKCKLKVHCALKRTTISSFVKDLILKELDVEVV